MIKVGEWIIVSPDEFDEIKFWKINCPYCGNIIESWDNPNNKRQMLCSECQESFKIIKIESR